MTIVRDRRLARPGDLIIADLELASGMDLAFLRNRRPSHYDDWFNGPSTMIERGWNLIDSTQAPYFAHDVDTTYPGALYMRQLGGGPTGTPGFYRPAPAIPFRSIGLMLELSVEATPFSFNDIGIWLGDATPTQFIHGCLDVGTANAMVYCGSYWPNLSTWSNNIGSIGGPGSSLDKPGIVLASRPHLSRFDVRSATQVDGYISLDGAHWLKWLDNYNPGFTIANYGIDYHAPAGAQVAWGGIWVDRL